MLAAFQHTTDVPPIGSRLRRRHSLRLRDFDYATPAGYFVTICVHRRREILGAVRGGIVVRSELGDMVAQWWTELGRAFPQITLDEHTIMPNHVHAVVILPEDFTSAVPLPRLIGWFKTMSTNEYLRARGAVPGSRLWQRGYYDHIIRSERALERIRQYIADNPLAWDTDPENPTGVQVASRRLAGMTLPAGGRIGPA